MRAIINLSSMVLSPDNEHFFELSLVIISILKKDIKAFSQSVELELSCSTLNL